MFHLKVISISLLFFSLVLISSAGKFDDDSSCESESKQGSSSEERHRGGKKHQHKHRHRGGQRPRPSRPPPKKCEDGWHTFDRTQGPWCVKVASGQLTYYSAISQCTALGAVLTGVQTAEERIWLAEEAKRQTIGINILFSSIWLGAQRIGQTTSFEWTDGHTTGTAGILFGPNQPDNFNGPQNCLQLLAFNPGYNGAWNAWGNAQLDDVQCYTADNPPYRMFACGKEAQ